MLTRDTLRQAVEELASRDGDLARIVEDHGAPPLWARPPGFATLVWIILGQQVSVASAEAAYRRLRDAIPSVRPRDFLTLDDGALRRMGFSRQKAGYCRALARAVIDGEIDLRRVSKLDDDAVRQALTRLKGVGRWTADIYLLMALRRPDIWPDGDLALRRSIQKVKCGRKLPSDDRCRRIAASWRPWRAAAARLLWHDYLSS